MIAWLGTCWLAGALGLSMPFVTASPPERGGSDGQSPSGTTSSRAERRGGSSSRHVPTIHWTAPGGGGKPTVEVSGADPAALQALTGRALSRDQGSSFLPVTVVNGAEDPSSPLPPVLGAYRVEAGTIRFQPQFPLEPGLRYRATFDPARLDAVARSLAPGRGGSPGQAPATADRPIAAEYAVPKAPAAASTTVTHVYPTSDTLPENQLKFYIHFSAPMSRGEAYDHVRLFDAAGKALVLPFLELGEELWDPAGTRFTLLFDPGRIKRGLKPREEFGPVLEEGKRYTLVIDRGWRDARGNPLTGSFRKSFRAGPPDDRPPDPMTWTIAAPAGGSRSALLVTFPEPLDHALVGRLIGVVDAAGARVHGQGAIEAGETRWRFTPERPWVAGRYQVVADQALEDLAGNSIGRPFEVDVFRKVEARQASDTVARPFRVEAPAPSGTHD